MIFVDRNLSLIPQYLKTPTIDYARGELKQFYNIPFKSRSQETFIHRDDINLRGWLLSPLRELFNYKCAYCESFIKDPDAAVYDHFRPSSGARGLNQEFSADHYWWLKYEWENFYYCCKECNQYKGTWFPVHGERAKVGSLQMNIGNEENALLIDPCRDHPEEHFIYNEQGEIDFLTAKGKATIEIIKLNRSELISARKATLPKLKEQAKYLEDRGSSSFDSDTAHRILQEWGLIYQGKFTDAYVGFQRAMLDRVRNFSPLLDRGYWEQIEDLKLIKKSIPSSTKPLKLTFEDKNKITEELNLDSLKHIYVEKLELQNFKCFSKLELNFSINMNQVPGNITAEDSVYEPWILFLGENGVGKSSLLKALVLGLCGNEYLKELNLLGPDILKHNTKTGYIKIYLVGANKPIEVHFTNESVTSTLSQPLMNLVGYNSIRLTPKKGQLKPETGKFYGARAKNLFDYTVCLTDAEDWLLTRNGEVFNRAALTLKDLMLLGNKDQITRLNGKLIIKRGIDSFRIDELSDGYQSIYHLAVDIMATLSVDKVSFDLVEGMVLIDEIGTHLHPRWKMEVVSRLRKAFPKVRFVVTTHEPLCLRGLNSGETIVLTKKVDNEITALTDLPDPSELRIDQILTSDFFGLNSTIDPETEKLFNEYYAILATDDAMRSDTQKNRLLKLSELIPRIKHLGNTLREELVYYVVDELLAKKTRNEGLKIKRDIKEEARKRVEGLWKLISSENENEI